MLDLEELIDTHLLDVQAWPGGHWCPECGAFIGEGVDSRKLWIPKRVEAKE